MEAINKIQLKLSSIMQVPFHSYETDFSFIVNGKEYKTSRIISDLLSSKISKHHSNDATFNQFIIGTQHNGDFSHILNLANFSQQNLPERELPFFLEVFESLGSELIEFTEPNNLIKLTPENVFQQLAIHSKYENFYSKRLSEEIEFISSNFDLLLQTSIEELKKLDSNILCRIVNNENFLISNEDQLLEFINYLYEEDRTKKILYEFVIFRNVTTKAMNKFIDIFDLNDITQTMWLNLCEIFTTKCFVDENDDASIIENVSSYYENDVSTLALVQNIPYRATAKDIGEFMIQQFGMINDVLILQENYLGKMYSCGIGYVLFKSKESFQKAIIKNNIEFKSENDSETRILNITQARKNNKYNTARIGNIPKDIEKEDIIKAFKKVKPIQVKFVGYRSNKIAYAKFESPNDLNVAIQYNNQICFGNDKSSSSSEDEYYQVSMSQTNFDII